MPTLSEQAAKWIKNVQFSDFPAAVIEDSKFRVLDYIGLILAAASMPVGKTFRDGVLEVEGLGNTQGHGATILGFGDMTSPLWATIANGGMSHALDYDDTHNETVNHITGPVASAALSLGESLGISGKEFLTTVAAGNELSCRIGTCSPTSSWRLVGIRHPSLAHSPPDKSRGAYWVSVNNILSTPWASPAAKPAA